MTGRSYRIIRGERSTRSNFSVGTGSGGSNNSVTKNLLFGVNMSGAEFSTPAFPSSADWSYLASKGITFVRLPVAWENLLTTVGGGTLQATYLANLKAAIAGAHAVGIGCIVDLHNFGAYVAAAQWGTTVTYAGNSGVAATGVSFLGNGVTTANLMNIWTLLSTALVGTPGLIGYGLMNEVSNNIVGTNLLLPPNNFNSSLTSWFPTTGGSVAILAAGTNPLGANYSPAWNLTVTASSFGALQRNITLSATPYTISCYAKVASGTYPNFEMNINNSGGDNVVTTAWQRFTSTRTPTAGAGNVTFQLNNASASTIQMANVQLELGSSASAYQPSPYIPFAQAAINAIRAVDIATPIYINGTQFSSASYWQAFNYEMAILTDASSKLVFEAHQYFDGPEGIGGGGTYSGTYTSYSIDSSSGSTAATVFLNWLTATGTAGFMGEFGVPNNTTDNNAAWLPLQVNFEKTLQAQRVPGTMWFYGNNGVQSGNSLNIAPVGGVDDPRLTQMLAIT